MEGISLPLLKGCWISSTTRYFHARFNRIHVFWCISKKMGLKDTMLLIVENLFILKYCSILKTQDVRNKNSLWYQGEYFKYHWSNLLRLLTYLFILFLTVQIKGSRQYSYWRHHCLSLCKQSLNKHTDTSPQKNKQTKNTGLWWAQTVEQRKMGELQGFLGPIYNRHADITSALLVLSSSILLDSY